MKEIQDNTKKWKAIPCSLTGRTNIVKMSILPQTICRYKAIPIKIQHFYITRTILNLYGITKDPE